MTQTAVHAALCWLILQDTLKPAASSCAKHTESSRMKKATNAGLLIATAFYFAVGCLGYSAFGDVSPTNLLIVQHVQSSRTGFTNPYWLVDCANVFVMINMLGGYQVSLTVMLLEQNFTSSRMAGLCSTLQHLANSRQLICKLAWLCINEMLWYLMH